VDGEVRYYSVEEAARVLRLTPERVREMLEAGELEGVRTVGTEGWRVSIHGGPGVAAPPVERPPAPTPMEATTEQEMAPTESADETSPDLPAQYAETRDLLKEPGEPGLPAATIEETRQPAEVPRGESAATSREPTSESGWVSTQQAAKALGISARTVRWHIERGNLDAKPEGEGVERTWRVSVDSLQAFRDSRQAAASLSRSSRGPNTAADIAAESPGSAIRELADRLVEEARRAEAARVRLELAERAQSSLEAELSEERRRREVAEREREEAQRERDELRRRLEAPKSPEVPRELGTPASGDRPPAEVLPRAPETPAHGFGTDAAGGGPQRQASPRWWRRWRRS
jgi:excisionase family DNA binding protein